MRYALKTLALSPRLVAEPDGAERVHFSKQLAVIIYLAARTRAQATRDELVGLLWSGAPERDARASLRQVVYQIRQATDPAFVTGEELLKLRREDLEMDVDVFRERHAQGQLEAALAIYEHDFLASVGLGGARDFEAWAEGLRQVLAAERRQLLRALLARAADAGRWNDGARYAELLIDSDPAALEPRLKLIELLALSGDAVRARSAAADARVFAQVTEGDRLPVELEQVIGKALTPLTPGPSPAPDPLPRHPELVGRAAEFRILVEKWKLTLQGRGRAALITGEAGIGKTRLAQELIGRARADRCLVLRSAFFPIERSDPMGPFVDLLRGAATAPGLGGASPGCLAILGSVVPEIADRFAPASGPGTGGGSAGGAVDPQALGTALLDAFAAIAEEIPLVLAVEDLHWASPESIDFAHRLARHVHAHHILLVLTARDYGDAPGATEALRALTAGGVVREVPLGPLSTVEIGQLLASIAELPDQETGRWLSGQLARRALGVPLYVLEILKSLFDTKLLSVSGGRWDFGAGLKVGAADLPIPGNAASLLEHRLRTVGERAAAVLAAMAVWGRAASPAVLARLTGLEAGEVDRAIGVLERRRLVVREGDAVVVAHDEFAAAATRAAPVSLVLQLYGRAARLARDSARAGRPGDWMIAARFAAMAGRPDRAALDAARAGADVQRTSGRGASREMLARALEGMPSEVRGHLQVALEPVLRGRWSARRWLAERSGWPRRLRGAGAILGVAVIVLAGIFAPRLLRSAEDAPQLGGGEIAIGWGVPSHLDSVRALRVDDRYRAHFAPLESLPPGVRRGYYPRLIRSDRPVAAFSCPQPGVDALAVCERDLVTGATSTLARFEGDALPVGWLPDASALLVQRAYPSARGRFSYGVVLVDTAGRVVRTVIRDSTSLDAIFASPAGDRILAMRFREGRNEAALLTLGGSLLGILDWCSRSEVASWSPHGRRVACAHEQSRELEIGDDRPGSWPTHVRLPEAIVSGPVWSADGRYIAVTLGGRDPGVWVVDRDGIMEPRRVASFATAPRLIGWVSTMTPIALHKVRVVPDSLHLAVGESRSLAARGLGPAGEPLGVVPDVRWLSADSAIARVDEDGRVVADRPGRTFVIAAFGLERIGDTCDIAVDAAPVRLVLDEGFERQLDVARWRPFGDPAPRVLLHQGRSGSGGFNPNGDYSLTSGIALRTALAVDKGLTIEYWSSVPITPPVWQSVKVGLYPAPADSFHLGPGPTSPSWNAPAVSVDGPLPNEAGHGISAEVSDAEPSTRIVALPERLADGGWHRYQLVVYPGGEVRWFGDGAELVPPGRADLAGQALWTLVIEGRSIGTLTMVDDVRVWEGVVLDAVQPGAAPPRRGVVRRIRE